MKGKIQTYTRQQHPKVKDTQAFPLSHLSVLLDQTTGPQKIATPTEREGEKSCETTQLPIQND